MVRRAFGGSAPSSATIALAVSSESLLRVRRKGEPSSGRIARRTTSQCQAGAPFLQRQENVALSAEVDQISLPVTKLGAQMRFRRPLVNGNAVRDRRLASARAPSPASRRLALRQLARQARLASGGAVGVAVDGLRTNAVLQSLQFHPPRDLLRRPSPGKRFTGSFPVSGSAWQGGPRHAREGGWSARSASLSACAPRPGAMRRPGGSQ